MEGGSAACSVVFSATFFAKGKTSRKVDSIPVPFFFFGLSPLVMTALASLLNQRCNQYMCISPYFFFFLTFSGASGLARAAKLRVRFVLSEPFDVTLLELALVSVTLLLRVEMRGSLLLDSRPGADFFEASDIVLCSLSPNGEFRSPYWTGMKPPDEATYS